MPLSMISSRIFIRGIALMADILMKKYVKLSKTRDVRFSSDKLISDLKRVAAKLHANAVTFRQYQEKGEYSTGTFIKRFGSWNNALEKAGLLLSKDDKFSSDKLISDLKRVAAQLQANSVTYRQYQEKGKYSTKLFTTRFGSWNNALEKAGRPVSRECNITDNRLFDNIERLWVKLGRRPRKSDLRKSHISDYTEKPYVRRFGSLGKAMDQFIAHVNCQEESGKRMNDELRRVLHIFI